MTVRDPASVSLSRVEHGLWQIDVALGDDAHPFLLDTGAGITVIDTKLANLEGLRPEGRLTGFRMTGDRVDIGTCSGVVLEICGQPIRHEVVGVLDLAALLPEGFPPIGGVVALSTFAELPVTFDFRRATLTLESDESLAERTPAMMPLEVRVGRPLQGLAAEVFVAVRKGEAKVWLELDSANTGCALLAPHAALQLGLDVPEDGGVTRTPRGVQLELGEGEPCLIDVAVRDLIIDGNLGATFMEERAFALDLRLPRLWVDRIV